MAIALALMCEKDEEPQPSVVVRWKSRWFCML
jgi:hypothetical protein